MSKLVESLINSEKPITAESVRRAILNEAQATPKNAAVKVFMDKKGNEDVVAVDMLNGDAYMYKANPNDPKYPDIQKLYTSAAGVFKHIGTGVLAFLRKHAIYVGKADYQAHMDELGDMMSDAEYQDLISRGEFEG